MVGGCTLRCRDGGGLAQRRQDAEVVGGIAQRHQDAEVVGGFAQRRQDAEVVVGRGRGGELVEGEGLVV